MAAAAISLHHHIVGGDLIKVPLGNITVFMSIHLLHINVSMITNTSQENLKTLLQRMIRQGRSLASPTN